MPKQSNKSEPTKKPMSLWAKILLSAVAAFCLIIGNSAIWFKQNIFDTAKFTNIASDALLSESSRQATATEITDRLLVNRPVLKSVIDDRVEKLVSALLGSNFSERVVDRSVSALHTTLTSKNPQPVEIDLTGIKSTVSKVVTVIGQLEERTDLSVDTTKIENADVPDKITLFDPSGLPNIYNLGVVMMWLGPLSVLMAFGLLILVIYRSRRPRRVLKQTLVLSGGIVFLGGLTAVALGPLFKPPVLARVPNANMRVVAENLYNGFIAEFSAQATAIFVLSFIMIGAAMVLAVIDLWRNKKPAASKKNTAGKK